MKKAASFIVLIIILGMLAFTLGELAHHLVYHVFAPVKYPLSNNIDGVVFHSFHEWEWKAL